MKLLIDAIWSFVILGLTEAVAKPIASRLVKRQLNQYMPDLMKKLDLDLPELIKAEQPIDVEQTIRQTLTELSGQSWESVNLDSVFQTFDLRIALNHLNGLNQEKKS